MTNNKTQANILIVDDTLPNLRLLTQILSDHGYKVRGVPNGAMALTAARTAPPDLILLDIMMPDMDGYEVYKQLQTQENTCDIPVIFISALAETEDKIKAFTIGGMDYITKPFQTEEVLARVKTHLSLYLLQQNLQAQNLRLQTINHQMQNELILAGEIQQGVLLPPQPAWTELDVVCYTNPMQEIGGDFYHYHAFAADQPLAVPNDDAGKRYAFAVGDVSGKGVSAALLMTICLSQLDSSLARHCTPAQRMAQLDQIILPYTQPRRQNCAMCYLELTLCPDEGNGPNRLDIVNAGCIPPYIRHTNANISWPEMGGFALGQNHDNKEMYQQKTLNLNKGDIIILTTDGVAESKDGKGQMFGFERLKQAIAQGPMSSAQAMLNHLQAEIEAFRDNMAAHDDLTIIVIQLKNKGIREVG